MFKSHVFCRKFQILKMFRKQFSAYPKKTKSDFSKIIEFLILFPSIPLWGGLLYKRAYKYKHGEGAL